jgi:hypothetical protein
LEPAKQLDYNIQPFATMAPLAMVKANAKAKAAGKAFGKPKAAGKAFGKAKAKAAGKAFGKAKAKAASKAVAKSKAKAAAKAVGKAKAVAMAVAAMPVQMFIVNGATDAPANTIVVDTMMAVGDVMDKIQEQEGIPHNQQRFVVEDVRAVSDYRLRIGLSQAAVPIETPSGTVWVEARLLYDMDKIKLVVEDCTGIPQDMFKVHICTTGYIVATVATVG